MRAETTGFENGPIDGAPRRAPSAQAIGTVRAARPRRARPGLHRPYPRRTGQSQLRAAAGVFRCCQSAAIAAGNVGYPRPAADHRVRADGLRHQTGMAPLGARQPLAQRQHLPLDDGVDHSAPDPHRARHPAALLAVLAHSRATASSAASRCCWRLWSRLPIPLATGCRPLPPHCSAWLCRSVTASCWPIGGAVCVARYDRDRRRSSERRASPPTPPWAGFSEHRRGQEHRRRDGRRPAHLGDRQRAGRPLRQRHR